MFRAVRYGGTGAPYWLSALQLAEAWGVPPWDIMHHPEGIEWAARWACYRKQLRKSRDMDRKQQNR